MMRIGFFFIFFIIMFVTAVLVGLFLLYYFSYRRYLNRRINGECNKKWFPHPLTFVLCLVLILSIIVNVILFIQIGSMSKERDLLENELINSNSAVCVTEFQADSPYLYYRDLLKSGDSSAYKISQTESNGFKYYFAECEYEYADNTGCYPQYICYVECSKELSDDIDMTIEYVYDDNNSLSSTGEPIEEIMFLSKTLDSLPQKIIITISERTGDKLTEGKIIAEECFEIYSVN